MSQAEVIQSYSTAFKVMWGPLHHIADPLFQEEGMEALPFIYVVLRLEHRAPTLYMTYITHTLPLGYIPKAFAVGLLVSHCVMWT